MRFVSRTENKTRLEDSLKAELMGKFSEECDNNILVFKNSEVEDHGHLEIDVVEMELFYNPFSECDCFQGRRFSNYIERFLTLSSLLDGRLEILQSHKKPVISKPEDFPENVNMKKFLKLKCFFSTSE